MKIKQLVGVALLFSLSCGTVADEGADEPLETGEILETVRLAQYMKLLCEHDSDDKTRITEAYAGSGMLEFDEIVPVELNALAMSLQSDADKERFLGAMNEMQRKEFGCTCRTEFPKILEQIASKKEQWLSILQDSMPKP